MMRSKSPQEKKALSYEKDCRNSYGENDKASRKLIPLRKAQVNRVYRRKVNEVLGSVVVNKIDHADTLETAARNIKRKNWKKAPDRPLGKVVERKLERRANHAGNGKTARKKTTEFLKALRIETEQETDGRWIAEAMDLNGVIAYGETKDLAISSYRALARVVHMEKLGACEILSIDEKGVSILSK
jgi:hypothetical protein